MVHIPRLLINFDTAMRDQAAVIIGIKDLQGLLHWGIGRQDSFAPRFIVLPMALPDHDGIHRVGVERPPVRLALIGRRAILLIGGQLCAFQSPQCPAVRCRAVLPCPWRLVCARLPTVTSSPAAVGAGASALTAILLIRT
jgi:hypothetical protein